MPPFTFQDVFKRIIEVGWGGHYLLLLDWRSTIAERNTSEANFPSDDYPVESGGSGPAAFILSALNPPNAQWGTTKEIGASPFSVAKPVDPPEPPPSASGDMLTQEMLVRLFGWGMESTVNQTDETYEFNFEAGQKVTTHFTSSVNHAIAVINLTLMKSTWTPEQQAEGLLKFTLAPGGAYSAYANKPPLSSLLITGQAEGVIEMHLVKIVEELPFSYIEIKNNGPGLNYGWTFKGFDTHDPNWQYLWEFFDSDQKVWFAFVDSNGDAGSDHEPTVFTIDMKNYTISGGNAP